MRYSDGWWFSYEPYADRFGGGGNYWTRRRGYEMYRPHEATGVDFANFRAGEVYAVVVCALESGSSLIAPPKNARMRGCWRCPKRLAKFPDATCP
jgi:hypothetical protein